MSESFTLKELEDLFPGMSSAVEDNEENDITITLFEAVRKGDYDRMVSLFAEGANVHAKDADGWTLLHHAAELGHTKIVEYLIDQAASDIPGWGDQIDIRHSIWTSGSHGRESHPPL
ncbi:MAG: hypothetical protein IEMM0008_1899 [bacterium]|nr:MAG: hypothetical protein IEMM0008_1899 [bacterium]